MITRLQSVLVSPKPLPLQAYVIYLDDDRDSATADVCYWGGVDVGWTIDRREAMEILPFTAACEERRRAKASGIVGRVGLRLEDRAG